MTEVYDPGDKLTVGLSFTRNLGDYSSLKFQAAVTVTKRHEEADKDFRDRAWSEAEHQLQWEVAKQDVVMESIRGPVEGTQDDWS